MDSINITEKFARFSEQWQPKIVAELNGQEVKLVKVQGTFPWHHVLPHRRMFPRRQALPHQTCSRCLTVLRPSRSSSSIS
jgi:hypothetical protein